MDIEAEDMDLGNDGDLAMDVDGDDANALADALDSNLEASDEDPVIIDTDVSESAS